MDIEAFIIARYEEWLFHATSPMEMKTIKMIEEVIEQHRSWPVLLETPTEVKPIDDYDALAYRDLNHITYSINCQIEFVTRAEYTKRFGTEAPSTPVLRSIARMWKHHKDFNEAWSEL